MTTFFSSIQNYFDAKYEGRYSAIILRELALHEPTSFAGILERVAHAPGWSSDQRSRWSQIARALRENSLTPTVEYPFFRRKSGTEWLLRKADLALTAGDSAELLFEIKELDFANPRNAAQLDDYLRVAKRVPFVLLTRFRPSEIDMKKIARAQQASCMGGSPEL